MLIGCLITMLACMQALQGERQKIRNLKSTLTESDANLTCTRPGIPNRFSLLTEHDTQTKTRIARL